MSPTPRALDPEEEVVTAPQVGAAGRPSRWPRALGFLAILAVLGGAGWWAARTGVVGAVYDLREIPGASRVRLRWYTGLPSRTRLRVRAGESGESVRMETRDRRREHRVSLAAVPGVPLRYEVLLPDGSVAQRGEVTLGPDPLRPESLEVARPDASTLEVTVRARHLARARLELDGLSDLPIPRVLGEGTTIRLRLEGLPLDAVPTAARLVLEAADGTRRVVPLDPERVSGTWAAVEAFEARVRHRYLPLLARTFQDGDLRVGRSEAFRERLEAAGFLEDWERQVPRYQALFASEAIPAREKRALLRQLSILEDIDSLLRYMEAPDELGIRAAYGDMPIRRHRVRVPALGPRVRRVPMEPAALLPEGVVSALSGILTSLGGSPTQPLLRVPLSLSAGDLVGESFLIFSFQALNNGLVTEVHLGDVYLGNLRTARADWEISEAPPGPLRFHQEDDRLQHIALRIPRGSVPPGEHTLTLHVRPLHGIPLSEAGTLKRIHLSRE